MNPSKQTPLKVCMLVLQHPFLDARIFKREALSLVKLGYEVTMVVPRNKDGLMYDIDGTPFKNRFREPVFIHESVKVVSYKAVMPEQAHMGKAIQSGGFSLFNDPLFKVGLAQNADIYHAHEYHSLYSGIGIKRALKQTKGKSVKLIYDSHEITEGNKVPLLKRMLQETDSVITVSDAMERWYRDNMPSQLPVVTLYNSPPLSASYTPPTASKDTFVACYEGYMHKDKGSSAKLFDITAMCSKDFPFRFKILGGVAGKSLTIPAPIQNSIQLCGWVDYHRIPEYMKDVDVGWIDYDIQASTTPLNYQIALPNKLFSYLNNGVPVVVNQCPEMARFVRQYECGIVIDHPNPTASQFAESFRYLRSNRSTLLKMSLNARKIMSEQYSWEHMETRLDQLYSHLAEALRTNL